MTYRQFLLIVTLWVMTITASHASEDPVVEWRLLGPTLVKHASNDGAPVTTPASASWNCTTAKLANGFNSLICNQGFQPEKRAWSSYNAGIGIERAEKFGTHTDRMFAMAVKDSYGAWGGMAGVSRAWPIAHIGTFDIDAGLAGGLWYRTTLTFKEGTAPWSNCSATGNVCQKPSYFYVRENVLERRLFPFVFPVATITESTTGIGLNVAFAPKIKVGDRAYIPTSTLMMQITYKLNF